MIVIHFYYETTTKKMTCQNKYIKYYHLVTMTTFVHIIVGVAVDKSCASRLGFVVEDDRVMNYSEYVSDRYCLEGYWDNDLRRMIIGVRVRTCAKNRKTGKFQDGRDYPNQSGLIPADHVCVFCLEQSSEKLVECASCGESAIYNDQFDPDDDHRFTFDGMEYVEELRGFLLGEKCSEQVGVYYVQSRHFIE
jgi:hypothetical protein